MAMATTISYWSNSERIAEEIEALASKLSTLTYQTYAEQPSQDEIAALRTGNLEERIGAVIRLNDRYRDGYSPSASIAGVAHLIHVSALPVAPAAHVPAVADVLVMMDHGLTQAQAVYALGGSN